MVFSVIVLGALGVFVALAVKDFDLRERSIAFCKRNWLLVITGVIVLDVLLAMDMGGVPNDLALILLNMGAVLVPAWGTWWYWKKYKVAGGNPNAIKWLLAWAWFWALAAFMEFGSKRIWNGVIAVFVGSPAVIALKAMFPKSQEEPVKPSLIAGVGRITHRVLGETVKDPEGRVIARPGELRPSSGQVIQDEETRFRHTYILGQSGQGKTNLLTHLILQDIFAGRGVAVLTPQSDLIEDNLLMRIPRERLDDVVYFNPADPQPIPFNLFHRGEGENTAQLANECSLIIERAIGHIGGAQMEAMFDYTVRALVERPNSTIRDFERVIDPRDRELRNEIILNTKDERIKRYFVDLYPMAEASARRVLTRLHQVLQEPVLTVMSHPQTISFADAMDNRKIMLFNLSVGNLSETTSNMFGKLIVAKMHQAIFSRERIPEEQRVPFYFYIDEFQQYTHEASESYKKLLTQGRKYRAGMYLAHQDSRDIPDSVYRSAMGAATKIAMYPQHHEDTVRMSQNLGVAQEELTKLDVGKAFIRVHNKSYKVDIPLVTMPKDPTLRQLAKHQSRTKYGIGGLHDVKREFKEHITTPTEPKVYEAEIVDDPDDTADKGKELY